MKLNLQQSKISKLYSNRMWRTIGAMSLVMGLSSVVWTAGEASASTSHSDAHVSQGFMTLQEGAALNIYPNESTAGFTVSTPVVEHVISDSANGCNQAVCISIVGGGTQVTGWSTTGTYAITTPAFAVYYDNGTVIATSSIVEAHPGEILGDQMIGTHNFPRGHNSAMDGRVLWVILANR
jgi:hypothetical protein